MKSQYLTAISIFLVFQWELTSLFNGRIGGFLDSFQFLTSLLIWCYEKLETKMHGNLIKWKKWSFSQFLCRHYGIQANLYIFKLIFFWNTFWCSFISENLGSVALLIKILFWLKKSKILHFATQNWPKIAYFSLFWVL